MADRQFVTIEVSEDVARRLREEAAVFGYENDSAVVAAALDALDDADFGLSEQSVSELRARYEAAVAPDAVTYSAEEVLQHLREWRAESDRNIG